MFVVRKIDITGTNKKVTSYAFFSGSVFKNSTK